MTGVTTGQLALLTGTDSDDTEQFLTVSLTSDLQTLTNLFDSTTGHTHAGPGQGGPIGGSVVTLAGVQDLSNKTYAATQTGAVAGARFIGGTATGAPTTGAHLVGDFVIDQTGKVWICTVAGTPGTWVQPTPPTVTVLHSVAVNDTVFALRNFI